MGGRPFVYKIMTQNIRIEDNSGDKRYFTIAPNYILNHSTANDQALYMQLKRLAGENSYCYPSKAYLKKQLKCGEKKLKKSFKYLLDKKWITYLGKKRVPTKGGEQWIDTYKVEDIWEINSDYYQGCSKRDPLSKEAKGSPKEAKGSPKEAKGSPKEAPKKNSKKNSKNNYNKINDDSENRPVKRKDFKVSIGTYKRLTDAYQQFKGIELKGAEFGQVKQAIKTMLYSGRTEQEIMDFMKFAAEKCEQITDPAVQKEFCWLKNWTMITIKKKMPEFLAGKFGGQEEPIIPSYAKHYV